jgi:hypothetical protein
MSVYIDYSKRAEFYDAEYNNNEDHYFITECIKKYNVSTVCEVPCATGRNFDLLSNLCDEVHLVDDEPEMLKQAKAKNTYGYNIHYYRAKMQNFVLSNKVDLVWIPQGALQLLDREEDIIDTFINADENLSRKGVVVVDIIDFSSDHLPDYLSNFDHEFILNWKRIYRNKILHRYSRSRRIENDSRVETSFRYDFIGEQAVKSCFSQVKMKIIGLDKILSILSGLNFSIIDIFGNYNFERVSTKTNRFLLLARKNENRI